MAESQAIAQQPTESDVPGAVGVGGKLIAIKDFVVEVVREFMRDECTTAAAALSYFTVFSLPALLFFVIFVAGLFLGSDRAVWHLEKEAQSLVGAPAAAQLRDMIQSVQETGNRGVWAAVIGIGVLLFGASGVFIHLQGALNRMWEVEPDPKKGGVRNFITKRLLSFGMVLALGFLLLVSLAISAAVAAAGDYFGGVLPGGVSEGVVYMINLGVSFAIFGFLFAAMYKILPDVEVRWRHVWVGALVASALFLLGKFAIGLYLGHSKVASAFGAAASLAIILVWINYAAIVLFLGAEITQVWAHGHGNRVLPEQGAKHTPKP